MRHNLACRATRIYALDGAGTSNMRKLAATVLALALATTHGLLDEGGPIVQKDAPKGLRGAQADYSLDRAAVGRKAHALADQGADEEAHDQAHDLAHFQ